MSGPRNGRWGLALALGSACLLQAAVAAAHLGNISYADLEVRGNAVLLQFKYAAHVTPGLPEGKASPTTRAEVLALEGRIADWLGEATRLQAGGQPCDLAIENLVGPDAEEDLKVIALWTCAVPQVRGLSLDFHPLASVLDEWQSIVSLRLDGRAFSTVLTQDATHWRVGAEAAGAAASADEQADPPIDVRGTESAFSRFFALGVEHIWTGYDHLLFLLAVLLAGGGIGRLAAIVTSFTVAHSITLAAAATGLVRLPVAPVEALIALSIVYVAVENLLERGTDRRTLVTFSFGLIHGFGFASVLAESALEPGELLVPLLAFNLGVEAGQLAVVVVVVPLLALVLRGPHARRVRVVLSSLVALAGAGWAVERIAAIVAG